jgi:hypothetical protein
MRFPARAIIMAFLAFAPFLGHPAPAHAVDVGSIQFAGFVHLPTFPCSGCNGWFSSTMASGVLVDSGPLVVTNVSASFTYAETCPSGLALNGQADGFATLSGIGSSRGVQFHWERVGLVAVITTTGGSSLVGTAIFMPTTGLPVCTVPSPVDAFVFGTLIGVPAGPPSVPAECEDGVDNDLDGRTDYGSDPGCSNANDTTESDAPPGDCTDVAGNDVCVAVEAGTVFQNVAVTTVPTATHHVVGTVDIYRFDLPTGGNVTVPCVVLTVNATTANPCATAGGTFVSRDSTLVDRTESQPGPSTSGTPLASICNAQVTVTVRGIGVNDFPAFTLC